MIRENPVYRKRCFRCDALASLEAVRLGKLFEKKAEIIYNMTMAELLDDEEEIDS